MHLYFPLQFRKVKSPETTSNVTCNNINIKEMKLLVEILKILNELSST